MNVLWLLAMFQQFNDVCARAYHYARRNWILPCARRGGYDMVLLQNGQWMQDSTNIPEDSIVWRYYSDKHAVMGVEGRTGALRRWPWLSAATDTHDMTDFFVGLRAQTEALTIGSDKIFMLFAHQTGVLPEGDVTVVDRMGGQLIIPFSLVRRAAGAGSGGSGDVNYIR